MKSWRILTLGRTELYVHASLLVFVCYACLCGQMACMAVALLSILMHEGAHALVGTVLGQRLERIDLTPLGAVLRVEEDAQLPPWKRLVMLIAGPVMTFLLCSVAVALTRAGLLVAALGRMLFVSNLSILLLNLLPALPLDGGRILLLLLETLLPAQQAHRILRWIGNALGFGLIVLNVGASWRLGGWNLSLAIAGCCLLYCGAASLTTRAMAEYRFLLDRKIRLEQKGSLRVTCLAALHTRTLRQLVRSLPQRRSCIFLCYEAGSMQLMGMLTEAELLQQYFTAPERRLGDAVRIRSEQQRHGEIGTN